MSLTTRTYHTRVMVLFLVLVMGSATGQEPLQGQHEPPPPPREAWEHAIQRVFEQLNTLDLFALATKFGKINIKIPRELQKLPMRMVEGADELRTAGIELYVTELQFEDVNFVYDKKPEWEEQRPIIPTMVEFEHLGVFADAKTRLTTIPVGAVFKNGKIPVAFLPQLERGYDLQVLPNARAKDALLNDVQLKFGGPLMTGIANTFFSKKVAALILEHGVGQTLQMGQGDLISSDLATRLLNLNSNSAKGRALEALIDSLR